MKRYNPKKINNIVILTGAGISADSGIATFRAIDGLWENHRVEDVATPEGFINHPDLVQRFYNERRAQLVSPEIKPNAAHIALAKLQKEHAGCVTIVTQNIDNLHELGGAHSIFHMHGELLKVRCVQSGMIFDWEAAVTIDDRCTCCTPPQMLRPHIVWFGERPFFMEDINRALNNAELFIAIGTSGNVYPAAGFVAEAKQMGMKTLEINLEAGMNQSLFDESIYGKAAIEVPKWVEQFLEKQKSPQ